MIQRYAKERRKDVSRPRLSLRPYDTKCLLKNRFYIGEITYRSEVRSAEDEPILGHDLFER
jgi:hypothetical protein